MGHWVCCRSIVAVSQCVSLFLYQGRWQQWRSGSRKIWTRSTELLFLLWISIPPPANQHNCEQWTWIFHHYLWGFSSPKFCDIHRHSHMTPYTNTSKSHQQTWNSNPTSSATPIPSPLMKKHMIKMQTKTMIENCSFALLINDILRTMHLNNRKNMSTMNGTSDKIYINTVCIP